MKHARLLLSATLALAALCPALHAQTFQRGDHLYTQVNLHPDEGRSRLYAANFLQSGLIPAGSEVVVVSLRPKVFTFTVVSTGKTYEYENHKQANESFESHLAHTFGPSWDGSVVSRLSAVDRKGIEAGDVAVGMSRQAVILAWGYPPHLENPSLSASSWKYWRSRFDTVVVNFDENDKVIGIKD